MTNSVLTRVHYLSYQTSFKEVKKSFGLNAWPRLITLRPVQFLWIHLCCLCSRFVDKLQYNTMVQAINKSYQTLTNLV